MKVLCIPDEEFGSRIEKTQAVMAGSGVDTLLAFSTESEPAAVRYYSDYWPSFETAAVLIPAAGPAVLLVGPKGRTYASARSKISHTMHVCFRLTRLLASLACATAIGRAGEAAGDAPLPSGVHAVWDLAKAHREKTPTQERVCLNGLWRWQPAADAATTVPDAAWGFFKVPGAWPGITDYMQKECQTVFPHPSWTNESFGEVTAAWYQREITIPGDWTGRRIALTTEYVNSRAIVFVDGKKSGEILFPAGEVDLTSVCRPGSKHLLSLLVVALPLKAVLLSYNDTANVREVKGSVARRGLCGDVWLIGTPPGTRIADVKVSTSIRQGELTLDTTLQDVAPGAAYTLRAEVRDGDRSVAQWTKKVLAADLKEGRIAFTEQWKPENLWDLHTPQNMYQVQLTLLDDNGKALDVALPVRFGFREFWIDGRDFYLNGSRVYLSAVTLDNACVGAAWANYAAAKESLLRLQSFGINFVYTHNYDCQPGSHLSFTEILRAADDVGMLVALSQPHFGNYDWLAPDADQNNGYARHATFYVHVAQNHPSVVLYAMSHNAAGYAEDMNPDLIDGLTAPRDQWAKVNVERALRAEAIVNRLDPGHITYHHASGNLGTMHTSNFYPNFTPIQELSDWFGHWASRGVKPVFLCEYGAPFSWDWTMYRGWHKGKRAFGNAQVPWEFCVAEWSAQFFGDRAFQIGEPEKKNLRWEAMQFKSGSLWHRWDYPCVPGCTAFDDQQTVIGMYLTDNWRAFRTWGVSANSPWEFDYYWKHREGLKPNTRTPLPVDWENLQRPGYSPDYLEARYRRMDLAYERTDWVPTPAAQALLRNNRPLLAYIAGKAAEFTGKDHNFRAGETIEKQLVVINNSRLPVTCNCAWAFQGKEESKRITLPTGQQERLPLQFDLPATQAPGTYEISMTATFSTGEVQKDVFAVHVLPALLPPLAATAAKIAVWDPTGETRALLQQGQRVEAGADLSAYDILVIGKGALTADGPGPNISRVREGLKVIVFEQTAEALELRLGFRVAAYGLRQVVKRVPDHPLLAGLSPENLRDWRGEATLLSPRLTYELSPHFNYAPTVQWCGLEVTRAWRCGCRGTVASVLIEKPARGDFLSIVDGGYSLQYSPLMEFREGKGMILFCQMDVTGRTDADPAADTLVRNILRYAMAWKPAPIRKAIYAGDPAGKRHLEAAGFRVGAYEAGPLAAENVLILGPGAKPDTVIGDWIQAGGHVLALGLDETTANGVLPTKVQMKSAEYINSTFEPAGMHSGLAGIGPADVYNRDPRSLPLINGGVLAENANVVFCQLAPWQFDYAKQFNVKRTYRRTACLVTRLLSNLRVASSTPLVDRFHNPANAARLEKRWLDGFYLDTPEEMDDPYRFFRW